MLMVLKFALIGAGSSATNIAQAIDSMDSCEISIISDLNEESAQKVADFAHIPNVTTDNEEIYKNENIDAVIVSVPHYLHFELTLNALKAGKHVLCEKPLAISLEQVDEMIHTAETSGLKLGTFFQCRFEDAAIKAKEMIENNAIGTLLQGNVQVMWTRPTEYYQESAWRGKWATEGGGSLINQSTHSLDLLAWLLGEIESVFGYYAHRVHEIEVDDNSCGIVKFKNGVFAAIQTSTAATPGYPSIVSIYGTKGMIQLKGQSLIHTNEEGETQEHNFEEQIGSFSDPKLFNVQAHTRLIQNFVDSVEKDEIPLVDGKEGRRSIELVEGIFKSNGEKVIKY